MISGAVSDLLEPMTSLSLRDEHGQLQQIEAIIDTGFTGSLTLPASVIDSLRLPWVCRQQGMLADGKVHPFDVYQGTVVWDGAERIVEIEAADVDPLIGMALLSGHQLAIQVRAGGSVSIQRLK